MTEMLQEVVSSATKRILFAGTVVCRQEVNVAIDMSTQTKPSAHDSRIVMRLSYRRNRARLSGWRLEISQVWPQQANTQIRTQIKTQMKTMAAVRPHKLMNHKAFSRASMRRTPDVVMHPGDV